MNYPNNGFPPPPGFPQTPAPAPQGYTQPQQPAYPQPQYAPQYAAPQGYPQQPSMPLPTSLGLDAQLQTAEEDSEKLPPLPEGGHELCEVDRVYMERGKQPSTQHVISLRADCIVVQSRLAAPGTRFCLTFRIVGATYGQADEVARCRSFLAVTACNLNPEDPAVKQHVTEQLIMASCQPQNPLKGKRFAIPAVYHKMTKAGFHQNGSPKPSRPIGKYTFAVPGAAVAPAPAPQAVPVAVPAQAPVWPPAGWQDVGHMYPGHWTNGQMTVSVDQLKALVAAGKA